jgi:hypothetical protein
MAGLFRKGLKQVVWSGSLSGSLGDCGACAPTVWNSHSTPDLRPCCLIRPQIYASNISMLPAIEPEKSARPRLTARSPRIESRIIQGLFRARANRNESECFADYRGLQTFLPDVQPWYLRKGRIRDCHPSPTWDLSPFGAFWRIIAFIQKQTSWFQRIVTSREQLIT